MFHAQHWTTRPPTSSFQQTVYETEQQFYATFPAARAAAHTAVLEQSLYNLTISTGGSYLHDDVQPLDYNIYHGQASDISNTSLPFNGITQPLPYPPLRFDYSQKSHSQKPSASRVYHQDQPSFNCPPLVENHATVYNSPRQPYHPQHSSESVSSPTARSSSSSVSPQQPIPSFVKHLSNTTTAVSPPNVNTYPQETISDGYAPESPRHDFCQLNRHMKPPTLKFANDCRLAVMRLARLSERGRLNSTKRNSHLHGHLSKSLHVPSRQITPTATEFLLSSPKSPSIGLSSLPSKNLPERKPPLACLFCRGRKIACGPPLPGSSKKTCNQCRKRSLQCHYPLESRRGMRKKKSQNTNTDTTKPTTLEITISKRS